MHVHIYLVVLYMVVMNFGVSISENDTSERQERVLNYKHTPGGDGLNFEHIISLWNRSAVVEEDPPISQRWSLPNDRQDVSKSPLYKSTLPPVTTTVENNSKKPIRIFHKLPESFPERFKMCVGHQQKYVRQENSPGQNVIIKCFKTELISKLQRLLSESNSSFKLFNGYLEFEKIKSISELFPQNFNQSSGFPSRKRYSSRVTAKKSDFETTSKPETLIRVPLKQSKANPNHGNEYYENYQKMLKELVSRKSGTENYQRIKRNTDVDDRKEEERNSETLQKTANLFENGRKLISEISNRLENDEDEVENLTETILDPELVSTLNTFSRSYAVKLNFYPGISARMKRNQNSGVTFDLELDELSDEVEEDDDDDDDEEDEDSARGDKKNKKKKKKKKIKISKKTLKKLFPYLLIPFMIQAALLPFVLKFLLFVAIKALIAGKLALVLVAFNVLKNASHKSDEDEYAERMAVDHYGYGQGEEYGAWVNRRTFVAPSNDDTERQFDTDPYRAYKPAREGRQTN